MQHDHGPERTAVRKRELPELSGARTVPMDDRFCHVLLPFRLTRASGF
jgi:hypothetical protein